MRLKRDTSPRVLFVEPDVFHAPAIEEAVDHARPWEAVNVSSMRFLDTRRLQQI